ncbi:ribosomal RNA processing protein 36 homolog [Octopus sinensis]|uniref:rRNA biogenesis protein RRP36 n=1 Tax=Octopus sinensis TaxID=2607531 RepID=A0A6P7TYK3_9MOLL|nr:ribosomal RNA processing protein 36 homolog [Octopus sinensis]
MLGCKKPIKNLGNSKNEGPLEMSSKKPKKRVPDYNVEHKGGIDPRFHENSTQYGPALTANAYKFVGDLMKEESKILKNRLKDQEISQEEREGILEIFSRRKQQKATDKNLSYEKKVNSDLRKMQIEMYEKGLKPRFITKKEKSELVKQEKMKSVSKSKNTLSKYLQRKERRNRIKDRKKYEFLNSD